VNTLRMLDDGEEEDECGGDENDISITFIQSCMMHI